MEQNSNNVDSVLAQKVNWTYDGEMKYAIRSVETGGLCLLRKIIPEEISM